MLRSTIWSLSCLIFIVLLSQSLALTGASKGNLKGKPNPINPSFNYIEVNKVDKAKLNIPYPGEFYTGYITVNQTSASKIFYQLYSAAGNKRASTVNDSAPLIMQLAGGPGSPGGGSYYEHGPFRVDTIDGDFVPVLNEVSWNDDYHLLYLDNPVGVGYAVENNDMPRFSTDNGIYLMNFLVRFFELFPNLKKQQFYAVGESYGGHFVLGLAHQLIANPQTGIQLTGIGFQGGWFDPYWQLSWWAKGLWAVGVIDNRQLDQMGDLINQFQNFVKAGNYSAAYELAAKVEAFVPKGIDTQDYRNDTAWDATTLIWLNMPNTKKYLAADPNTIWQSLSLRPWFYLDFPQSYASNVTYMLNNHNISFLFYQGQNDFLVPSAGTQTSLLHLGWTQLPLYVAAPNKVWFDNDGYVIGQYKHYGKLTYATINKAGHNSAHDQPWSVKNLIQKWINNKW